jgi:hypothetical protein
VAGACLALRIGSHPGKFFHWLVAGKHWQYAVKGQQRSRIIAQDEATARQWLKDYEATSASVNASAEGLENQALVGQRVADITGSHRLGARATSETSIATSRETPSRRAEPPLRVYRAFDQATQPSREDIEQQQFAALPEAEPQQRDAAAHEAPPASEADALQHNPRHGFLYIYAE